MWWSPAFRNVFRFIQSCEALVTLDACLASIIVPHSRRNIIELHNLLWLQRNLHINNSDKGLLDEAKRILRYLIKDDLFKARDMVWGSM